MNCRSILFIVVLTSTYCYADPQSEEVSRQRFRFCRELEFFNHYFNRQSVERCFANCQPYIDTRIDFGKLTTLRKSIDLYNKELFSSEVILQVAALYKQGWTVESLRVLLEGKANHKQLDSRSMEEVVGLLLKSKTVNWSGMLTNERFMSSFDFFGVFESIIDNAENVGPYLQIYFDWFKKTTYGCETNLLMIYLVFLIQSDRQTNTTGDDTYCRRNFQMMCDNNYGWTATNLRALIEANGASLDVLSKIGMAILLEHAKTEFPQLQSIHKDDDSKAMPANWNLDKILAELELCIDEKWSKRFPQDQCRELTAKTIGAAMRLNVGPNVIDQIKTKDYNVNGVYDAIRRVSAICNPLKYTFSPDPTGDLATYVSDFFIGAKVLKQKRTESAFTSRMTNLLTYASNYSRGQDEATKLNLQMRMMNSFLAPIFQLFNITY